MQRKSISLVSSSYRFLGFFRHGPLIIYNGPSRLRSSKICSVNYKFLHNNRSTINRDHVRAVFPFLQDISTRHNSSSTTDAKIKTCLKLSFGSPLLKTLREHPAYLDYFYQPTEASDSKVKDFVNFAESSSVSSNNSLENENQSEFQEFLSINSPEVGEDLKPIFESIQTFSDDDLLLILYQFGHFSRPRPREFYDVWSKIDAEFMRRWTAGTSAGPGATSRWKEQICFRVADIFGRLGLGNVAPFHWNLVKSLLRRVDNLSREEFIRLCSLLDVVKKLPPAIKLYDLDFNVPRIISDADSNSSPISTLELATICQTYSRLKLMFRDRDLVSKIFSIVCNNAANISDEDLCTIFKGLADSNRHQIGDVVDNLLTRFVSQVPRLNVRSCCSLLHISARWQVKNEELLEAVYQKILCGGINEADTQDLKWISKASGDFTDGSHPIFNAVINFMKSPAWSESAQAKDEGYVRYYGKSLFYILNNMAHAKVYDEDLTSAALSQDALKRYYGNMFQYEPEVFLLSENVLAENPNYGGSRLTEKQRGFLLKKHMVWVEYLSKNRAFYKFIRDVYETLQKLFGPSWENYIHLCNILPHHRTIDILFCTNESGNLTPVPELFKTKTEYLPKTLTPEDSQGGIVYNVIMSQWKDTLLWNSSQANGEGLAQIRQIENMGYRTFQVPHNSWDRLSPEEDKLKILGRILESINFAIDDEQAKTESTTQR